MYIYLRSLNSLYSILTYVLFKNDNIVSNSILRESFYFLTNLSVSMLCVQQFPWDHMVWFRQSQWICSKLSQWRIKMAAFIHAPCWLQTLKEHEIIMLIYKIQTCRLCLLWFCAPDPTRQHEVWRKILLNTNWADRSDVRHAIPSD